MPTIHRFFTHQFIVKRMRDTGGLGRSVQATATVAGHVQEWDRQTRQVMGVLEERAFEGWFDVETDIKEDDIVYDVLTGEHWQAREVTKKAYGINQHLQVMLMKKSE